MTLLGTLRQVRQIGPETETCQKYYIEPGMPAVNFERTKEQRVYQADCTAIADLATAVVSLPVEFVRTSPTLEEIGPNGPYKITVTYVHTTEWIAASASPSASPSP